MLAEDFTNWPVAGRGVERVCYRNPQDPGRCIKISKKDNCKQSRREIKYLHYLQHKGVPFSHMSKFYRVVETQAFIGMELEFIGRLGETGAMEQAPNLEAFLRHLSCLPPDQMAPSAIFLRQALRKMKAYLIKYNVQVCDLNEINILVTDEKLMLIDGFGKNAWIPLHNYVPFFWEKADRKEVGFVDQQDK